MDVRPATEHPDRLSGPALPGRVERPTRHGRHDAPEAGLRERLAAVGGATPADRRHHRAQLVDGVLVELAVAAGLTTAGVALAAVGGYGRGELSPQSDLDLVLLHSTETPESYAALLAERLWYPIWDSGVKLDHSVRSVGVARQVARTDLPALLGMMDLRHIAGDPALTTDLSRRVLADWRADAPERLPALLTSGKVRAERSGELAYAAVPDLKESRGGLRDLSVMRAVAASWVADCPHQGLTEARNELLDIRDALRLLVGRAVDRIQVQDQDALAAALGLADRDDLMRRVSGIGRMVGHAADLTWYRVGRALSGSPVTVVVGGSGPRVQRRPLADGIVEQDGEAVLARSVDPSSDPALALRLGAAAALAGIPVAPASLLRVIKNAAPMPVPWPEHARRALIELLGAGEPLAGAWEALDQAGVITAILPAWDRLRSLPQRDPVHRHTVDRHLVQTAIEAAALIRRVDRPDLLLVTALLHDIGKGTGRDHSVAGAEIAPEWLAHLGFPAADAVVVVELVREHLLLAETALRRDPDDPATIEAVAARVGSVAMLDLLAALTEADAKAAGPVAWTPWKAGQVRILAERVRALLAGSSPTAGPETVGAEPVAGDEEPADAAEQIDVSIRPLADGIAVTATAPDRRGLLAAVAGMFALHRLTVRSASVSTSGVRARQEWVVAPQFGDGPDAAVLRGDLTRALGGAFDVAAALARRRGSVAVTLRGSTGEKPGRSTVVAAPEVHVVPGASRYSTVLEVRARDVPALLFVVATAVSALGIDVVGARVDTYGADAVDVFYLRQGRRPLDRAEQEAVVAAVTLAVAPA